MWASCRICKPLKYLNIFENQLQLISISFLKNFLYMSMHHKVIFQKLKSCIDKIWLHLSAKMVFIAKIKIIFKN